MYDYVKATTKTAKEMSVRAYNLIIGVVLLWGFVVNCFMCTFYTDVFLGLNPFAVIIGYFVMAIAGIFICKLSSNPFISFVGYNLVVVPVGVVLSIALASYDKISIMNALATTTVVTIVMILLASIVPDIFLSMGKVLFACLTAVLICEIIFILIGFVTPSFWDFIVALIFCGYIGYDWAEAQNKEYTLSNAIDSVVGLYLDIINLFIRILSASNKK